MDSEIKISRELLQNILEELYELRGQLAWSKDEIRCGYKARYDALCDEIENVERLLK